MSVRIQNGNKVLYVDELDIQHYIQKGYSVTTPNGAVVTAAIPHDIDTLKNLYLEAQKKIEDLEEEVARLTQELELKEIEPKLVKKSTKKS